ncbi:MAG TPA: aldehyde dehydrogenase family protein, partial [Acidimicrobiales bacterium]|nr:aldehyde dehydrogenase family protein [Acidimicrobiales bacterium]
MSPVDAGPPIATVNPSTGELLQSFEPYDAAGVEARLAVAASAAPLWAKSTFAERSRLLVTVAELLEGELPDIAHVVTTEMGKPFA